MDVICPTIRPSIHPPRQLSTRSLLIHIVEFATLWTTTGYSKLTRFSPAIRCLLSPYSLSFALPGPSARYRSSCILYFFVRDVTEWDSTRKCSASRRRASTPTKGNNLIIFYSKNSLIKFECKFEKTDLQYSKFLILFESVLVVVLAVPFELFKLNSSSFFPIPLVSIWWWWWFRNQSSTSNAEKITDNSTATDDTSTTTRPGRRTLRDIFGEFRGKIQNARDPRKDSTECTLIHR